MPEQLTGTHPGKQGTHKIAPTASDLPKITELAAAGKTRKGIALHLGISNSLLDKWMERYQEVREAWERGMAVDEERLVSKFNPVIDDPKHKMQMVAVMFLLKAKHKWRDRDEPTVIQVNEQPKAPSQFKVTEIKPPAEAGE